MEQYNKTIQKMINFDDVIKKSIKEHQNWPQIPNHLYRVIIIGGFESGKTNSLFNSMSQQQDIDESYLCVKCLYKVLCKISIFN